MGRWIAASAQAVFRRRAFSVVVVVAVWQRKTKGDTAAFELSGLGAEEERREEHD